jgi:hypothetical protein
LTKKKEEACTLSGMLYNVKMIWTNRLQYIIADLPVWNRTTEMTTFGSSDFGSHSLLHQILLYF